MPELNLFTSNRLEVLAGHLADVTRVPPASPMQPDIIIVPSQGMGRWLSLQLAHRRGICANYQFPFPKDFIRQIFHWLIPDIPSEHDFRPEILLWRILRQLPGLVEREEFASIRNYLEHDVDERNLFQLAGKIAWTFDQYVIFRPEMVRQWEAGGDDHWQAILWRKLAPEFKAPHPARLHELFVRALAQPGSNKMALPLRVSIFGVSALPPFYLDCLQRLAGWIEVNFFQLQPCRKYWGDISSEREWASRIKGKRASDAANLHLAKGNRLLASMGQLGRDYLSMIYDAGDPISREDFFEPAGNSMLATVQSDILNLRDRGRDGTPPAEIGPADKSIQVHNCHGAMREMEVLHDHILDWLQSDPTLEPRDILVLTPDIELYAPFIQAVFDVSGPRRIPFSLADRTLRNQGALTDIFFKLLALVGSRLGAAAVVGLLEAEPVRRKFSLAESDLDLIKRWMRRSGIRWGIDAHHRHALGLPGFDQNSWRAGLDRLLLGYAMEGEDELFSGILPAGEIESAETLGQFIEFAARVFNVVRDLQDKKTNADWSRQLAALLDSFFVIDEANEQEAVFLQTVFQDFADDAAVAGFDRPVPLAVVLEDLNHRLDLDTFSSGFLRGGVTFGALKPMRSIPGKIICLVGMNDAAFPRSSSHLSFDLMAQKPRAGDRSARDDDRYLFLETILSAREKLYLSFAGQSVRDNHVALPSVVVSELLDYIVQGFRRPGPSELKVDDLIVKHRLQAFSEDYFSGDELFSYSTENFTAAKLRSADRATAPAPLAGPINPPDELWREISLDNLIRFFCNPAEFFVTRRLGIRLPERHDELEETEPFDLDGLESYALREDLLQVRIRGNDGATFRRLITASGRIPVGRAGQMLLDTIQVEVDDFYKKITPRLPSFPLPKLPVELVLGEFSLRGNLDGITPAGVLNFRCADVKAADLIRAWIRHLVWNLAADEARPRESVLVGRDAEIQFRPVDDPKSLLLALLELYWRGLSAPLKFFPKTALAFVRAEMATAAKSSARDPKAAAAIEWDGAAFGKRPGEKSNACFGLCFRYRTSADLDDEVYELAGKIFRPLLSHAEGLE
jgi:exodeoxyribonuclease V gamma subunit